MFSIANILTALNLFCGSIAIVFVLHGNAKMAFILILLSLLFDFADGFVARALKQESELGIQLDSLADVVSFGVLPSVMMYSLINTTIPESFLVLIYLPFLLAVMSAFRLARFNIETDGSIKNFQGLPVPAMALAVTGFYMGFNFNSDFYNFIYNPYILLAISVLLSILMISRIPILKITPNKNFFQSHIILFILVIVCLIMIFMGNYIFLSVLILLHIIYSFFKLNTSTKK
ncbi:MAG: CDP-diacylglycerol--serine O-phosphatidyltransferase [Saprospiraceae bacterium]|nr:CDP-diacylglycerol--serine O-phosphatidyltransferase [Saprospiraceae bacterium]